MGGAAGDVADAVLPLEHAAVGDLDLEALDLLRELDALRVCQRLPLLGQVLREQDCRVAMRMCGCPTQIHRAIHPTK